MINSNDYTHICFIASHIFDENEYQINHFRATLQSALDAEFDKIVVYVSSNRKESEIMTLKKEFEEFDHHKNVHFSFFMEQRIPQIAHIRTFADSAFIRDFEPKTTIITFLDDDDFIIPSFSRTIKRSWASNSLLEHVSLKFRTFYCNHDSENFSMDVDPDLKTLMASPTTEKMGHDHSGTSWTLLALRRVLEMTMNGLNQMKPDDMMMDVGLRLHGMSSLFKHLRDDSFCAFVFKRNCCNRNKCWSSPFR